MWGSRDRDRRTVDCIACGASLARADAREYDKEGDRWERHGKQFEYLCKDCYRGLCHQPRPGLEDLLTDLDGADSRAEFLAGYVEAVEAGGTESESEFTGHERGSE